MTRVFDVRPSSTAAIFWLLALPAMTAVADGFDGAEVVSFYGYDDCIRLSNDDVVVTLCPAAGGRVLEYSLDGKNMLYLPSGDEGWTYSENNKRGTMNAGRFDIGPEKMVKRGPLLWMGRWQAEIVGPRQAKMTSQVDPVSGVQLVRHFQLDADSTQLDCTQTIRNVSDRPVSLCHWSRTFAVGHGIAVVPRSPLGRMPQGYVMYTDGKTIGIDPSDPNITVTQKDVVVTAPPKYPKLGFDSHAGWLAYLAPHDQMFVKRFRTFPQRSYNEVAGLTISIWYPQNKDMIELEPIGPAENLQAGQSASFTEQWWLLRNPFPTNGKVDCDAIKEIVQTKTPVPKD